MTNNERLPHGLSASALERMQLHMRLHGLHSSFSFLINNPAPWPKFHPIADRILQSQQDAMDVAAASEGQHIPDSSNATIDASQGAPFPNNPEPATGMSDNNLGDLDDGFSSTPSSSIALNMEQSNASFNSVSGLQAELHDLLYGKNGPFGGQTGEQLLGDLDCFREMDAQRGGAAWWADADGFDEKSSSSSWGSTPVIQSETTFQEYMVGYDI